MSVVRVRRGIAARAHVVAGRLRLAAPTLLAVATGALLAVPAAAQRPATGAGADTLARGRAIFASTCRSCHTITGSAQAAPPMARIAARYVAFSGSRVAAASRIVEWLYDPTAMKSLMPPGEIARYGVMPHQPLADAGRFAVAEYVVSLLDSLPPRARGRAPAF